MKIEGLINSSSHDCPCYPQGRRRLINILINIAIIYYQIYSNYIFKYLLLIFIALLLKLANISLIYYLWKTFCNNKFFNLGADLVQRDWQVTVPCVLTWTSVIWRILATWRPPATIWYLDSAVVPVLLVIQVKCLSDHIFNWLLNLFYTFFNKGKISQFLFKIAANFLCVAHLDLWTTRMYFTWSVGLSVKQQKNNTY